MNNFKLLLLFAIIVCKTSSAQNTIELPLIYKDGYGPFTTSFSGLGPNSGGGWSGINLKVKGIPEEWKNAEVGAIKMDLKQIVYQNFLNGNLSEDFYKMLQQGWNWTPDTLKLSKIPIKANIAFAYEKDTLGAIKMVIDANNNLDFSDDQILNSTYSDSYKSEVVTEEAIDITYERFLNNKIERVTTPVFIFYSNHVDMFMHNFPRYAVAELNGEEIAICSNSFSDASYEDIEMVLLNDSLKLGKQASIEEHLEEYITIKGIKYRNKGVDLVKNILALEPVDTTSTEQIYSSQLGFNAPLFKEESFITKDSIALEDYRGKYLYIDFWSLGCGPCIAEFPHLKEIYDTIDRAQIEFLGIVSSGGSDEDAIKELMDKHSVNWPHIISNKEVDLVKLYNVNKYPTTLLIDKEGRIIAKDLRSKELEIKLKELLK